MTDDDNDDLPPPTRLPLTARPPRLGLRVSGARVGDAVRPAASAIITPPKRFGLRANTSSLQSLARVKPEDEVA